jgi:hypothetical protein
VFYAFAPVHPSVTQTVIALSATIGLLAALTFAVNALSDPLQRLLGSQKRQLLRAIDEVEERLVVALKRQLRRGAQKASGRRYDTMDDVLDAATESGKVVLFATTSVPGKIARRFADEWRMMTNAVGTGILVTLMLIYFGGSLVLASYLIERHLQGKLETARALVHARSYRAALFQIDALLRSGRYEDSLEIIALRARSLCGIKETRACAEQYERLLRLDPRYAMEAEVSDALIASLAETGNYYPRRVIVDLLGARVVPQLKALALERRPVERWAIAKTLEQLGEKDLPYVTYMEIDLQLARRCKDKVNVIEKVADAGRPEVTERLRDILAKPSEKCLHEAIYDALAKVAPK